MSKFQEIASKALLKYPKTTKYLQISFYEKIPGKQLHMDTMFWQPVGRGEDLIPILVIRDMATRYTRFFMQERKNSHVKKHIEDFLKSLKSKCRRHGLSVSKDVKITVDGAKELYHNFTIDKLKPGAKVAKVVNNITSEKSGAFNKAVLAEVAIRQFRYYLRKLEAEFEMNFLKNVHKTNKEKRINRETLLGIISEYERIYNEKYFRIPSNKPPSKRNMKQEFYLGQPVFLINLHKYFPHQLNSLTRKASYDRPWYTEPFYVDRIYKIQGIYKYGLRPYNTNLNPESDEAEFIKYTYYTEQLKPIPSEIAANYIKNYLIAINKLKQEE